MNCCDDYGNCSQGRNCPVREAKVKHRYARQPGGKYVPDRPRQLKALAKWMLLALVAWLIWIPLLYLALRA